MLRLDIGEKLFGAPVPLLSFSFSLFPTQTLYQIKITFHAVKLTDKTKKFASELVYRGYHSPLYQWFSNLPEGVFYHYLLFYAVFGISLLDFPLYLFLLAHLIS